MGEQGRKLFLVPVRRPFPVWRCDPIHWGADDLPDAWGWVPHRFAFREFATAEEAEVFRRSYDDVRKAIG